MRVSTAVKLVISRSFKSYPWLKIYFCQVCSSSLCLTHTLTQIYTGYVDDPRNTDNAWMETQAVNFHDDAGMCGKVSLGVGKGGRVVVEKERVEMRKAG